MASDATISDPVSSDTDSDIDSISGVNKNMSPPISTIADVSIIREPIIPLEPFNLSKFTNSYLHRCGCCIGKRRYHIVKKRLNSIAAYKQQLKVFVPPVVPISDHLPVTPYVSDESKLHLLLTITMIQ